MSPPPSLPPAEVFRRVFEDIADYVALSLLDSGRYIDVNPGFQQFTGYSRDEAVGRSSVELGVWPNPADRQRFVEAVRREGTVRGMPFTLRRRQGELREVEMTGSVISHGGQQILVSVVHDVTERNRAVAELAEYRDRLELKVAERTRALQAANDALARAHKRLVASERQARFQAQHDPLTGLPNRALLADRLEQAISRAERGREALALLLIDLDQFRRVNDTLGQQAGDELLRVVARRLRGRLRKVDTVARLGNDQFVVALAGAQAAVHAGAMAHKVQQLLQPPVDTGHGQAEVTASIGVAVYPADGADVDTLLRAADTALLQAKADGGARVQFHSAQMQQAARDRILLEAEMRVALTEEQFRLHYQPQVDMRSGRMLAVEALVRWEHPRRGMVPPLDFISVAEETGLIVPLGEWVLREALRQLRRWRAMGHPALRVAVNLSPRQIWAPGFLEMMRAVLAESDLPGDALDVEITESLLIQPTPDNLRTLEQLARLGLHLYIDDFGTGYSSLSYLKSYPIHALKIDRAFVRNICDNERDLAITSTIIAMARNLQLQVIAEGVETADQARRLLQQGCTLGQGWHFGKPVEVSVIDELLRRQGAEPVGDNAALALRAAALDAQVRAVAGG